MAADDFHQPRCARNLGCHPVIPIGPTVEADAARPIDMLEAGHLLTC